MFTQVFGVETTSGNNDWMRGKLLQAVGLGNRWRPPVEPEVAAAAQRRQEEGSGRAMRQRHAPARLQQSSGDEDDLDEEEDEEARVVARRRKRGRAPPAASAGEKRGRPTPAASPRPTGSQRQQAQQAPPQVLQPGQPQQQQPGLQPGQQQPGQQAQQDQPTVVLMLPGGQVPAWAAEQLAWQQQAQQQAQQLQELQQQAQLQQLRQQVAAAQLLQQQQPFGFGGAAGFGGGPSPDLQRLLMLQQMSQSGSGGPMEQAALTALHALGLLPPGSAGLAGSLPPGMLAPPPTASPQLQLLQAGQPLLPPGQLGNWPLGLGPGFDEQQAAVAAAALAAAQQRQRQDGQLWQQQLQQRAAQMQQVQQAAQQAQAQAQAQQQAQQQAAAANSVGQAAAPVRPPSAAGLAVAAVPVKSVAAVPSTAPSPFAEQAAVPLSSSWTAHLQQQQQQPQAGEQRPPSAPPQPPAAQQQQQQLLPRQAGQGLGGMAAAATAFASQREGSLMADLKALEAMGWSASLASLPTLSADLHALFHAWQDGRVSMSLAPDVKPAP
ncbi:hypothetical protein C2E21_0654 [Chlorella sorokiniana]|uniref:Uncharacterized protein n=1 Tax=Chlorella sorokiniana TaxID=3076 RepID=A0A2P6U593_CHLSO|nr:hypothetical protein C2E21_0654 [Chlorella sorokiniana]|eukprot:PRW61496.1 hypothetical protein C2E21_0654 [Chlorella sorokiniana]